jgi:hypothetical protein
MVMKAAGGGQAGHRRSADWMPLFIVFQPKCVAALLLLASGI